MMPNLIHVLEYLGGGLGLILLGWVLRWGQHRDDCRADLVEEYGYGRHDGYGKGWDDALQSVELTGVLLSESAGYDVPGPVRIEGRIEEPAGLATMPAGLDEPGHFEQVGHTIYPELAALAAEDVPRPELLTDTQQPPGHLESTQEWQARMDLEAAQWCARHGLRHESAWAA